MASDNHRRIESGLSSRLIFPDEAIHFSRSGGGDHTAPKNPAGDGGGFDIDGRSQYGSHNRGWIFGGRSRSEGSYGEDEEDYDVDDDDDLDEGDGLVSLDDTNNNVKNGNNSSSSEHSTLEKENGEKSHSPFGLRRGMMVRDINLSEQEQQQQQQEPVGNYENAISVVHPESYCSQSMNGGDGSSSVQRETRGENGYVFSGRKEAAVHMDPGESLRSHFVDSITGELMDDAMILPCGHSFGSGGMQHVSRMKACCKCSRPILEDDRVRPNLALRSAVQAFRREEEQTSKVSKRRRDRFEQDKCSPNDPYPMDSRGKGVQFPFMVSDRVIIKGNKRTPERFVGRIAVVTTQCLNGWYVVKTLDNAESVKLQYRSLAKVADDSSPSNVIQNKSTTPSWL